MVMYVVCALSYVHSLCCSVKLSAAFQVCVYDSLRLSIIEISLISLHWFLTIFAGVVHQRILLRVLDLFFYHGSMVIFQITLGMLKMEVCIFFSLFIL